MRVSEKTGRKYCIQPDSIAFKAGSQTALIGNSQYTLQFPAEEIDGDLYISAQDMKRLVPDAPVEAESERAGVRDILVGRMGLKCCEKGNILGIGLCGNVPEYENVKESVLDWQFSERHVGDLFRAVWMQDAGVINTYRLYVPSRWNSLSSKMMTVVLHGAGGKENDPFDRAEGKLSYYAEKYGMLLLAPNSLVVRSNFGGAVPPSGQFAAPGFTDANGDPQYYSQETLEENAVAETEIMRIVRSVIGEFSVDKDKIFIMGNSMGGIGTFHLGGKYPGLFRAMSPAGALPEPGAVDWTVYGQRPILFVAGTEDHNGFEKMVSDYGYIKSRGVDISMIPVGGGPHSTAWTWEIPAVFDFFLGSLSQKTE